MVVLDVIEGDVEHPPQGLPHRLVGGALIECFGHPVAEEVVHADHESVRARHEIRERCHSIQQLDHPEVGQLELLVECAPGGSGGRRIDGREARCQLAPGLPSVRGSAADPRSRIRGTVATENTLLDKAFYL
ncbi:hypothetical protein [Curtobacterium sp. KT1]|uniref:hypothetical protein n=1 Tax=Curtobacterium sp. KT1 TaxID=3372858 RepID=UPI0037BFEEE9